MERYINPLYERSPEGDEGIGMRPFDYSGHKHALKT